MLSEAEILREINFGNIVIEPFKRENLDFCYYLTLGDCKHMGLFSQENKDLDFDKNESFSEEVRIFPKNFYILRTLEYIKIANTLYCLALFDPKIPNLFSPLLFIKPGFCGHICFYFYNCTDLEFLLKPGTKLAQIFFYKV
jgi:deoxycytidine triphosphate deaminase